MNYGDASIDESLWAKIIPEPNSGCWLWVGPIGRWGYGNVQTGSRTTGNRKTEAAHRVMFRLVKGPIAHVLDHLCRVRCCVNPAHLEDVPQQINVLRGESPMAYQARRTYCIHGHALTTDNTYHWRGHRSCMECRRRIDRNRRGAY